MTRGRSLVAPAITAAAILLTGPPAGAYTVFGGPVGTCGAFLETSAKSDNRMSGGSALLKTLHEIWLAGFLTGIGLVRATQGLSDVTKDMNPEGAAAWIEQYCREHPFEPAVTALYHYALYLADRGKAAPGE